MSIIKTLSCYVNLPWRVLNRLSMELPASRAENSKVDPFHTGLL